MQKQYGILNGDLNPEFKRNIWKEFSVHRLIAMPLILLLIFYISYSHEGSALKAVSETAITLMLLLLVVWGSGLAGDAVFEEIQDRTWETQKMTPLRPWTMTWGKLFGATSFVWYGTFFCTLAFFTGHLFTGHLHHSAWNTSQVLFEYFFCLFAGLAAQAFALFAALLIQRISPERSRTRVALIQVFTIIVFLSLYMMGKDVSHILNKEHSWYSLGIPLGIFTVGAQLFFIFWLIIGIYRLFRVELQVKTAPWVWPLFVILWVVFWLGYIYPPSPIVLTDIKMLPMSIDVWYWGLAYIIILNLTFLAAFFTPKNIVHSIRWVERLKKSDYLQAFYQTPAWMLTLIIGFFTLIPLLMVVNQSDFADTKTHLQLTGFSISLILFIIRDIEILYYLCWNINAKRAHLATIVYLILLYAFFADFSFTCGHFKKLVTGDLTLRLVYLRAYSDNF